MVNIQKFEIKMESLINEIYEYYNEDNIIDKIDHVLDVNGNIDCNADHDLIRLMKRYTIPHEELLDSMIGRRKKCAKICSKHIIDEEKHALIDHILNNINIENHESTDVQDIIEDACGKLFTSEKGDCIIFCSRNVYDLLKSKQSLASPFKLIHSDELDQKIICVGKDAIVWARCTSITLNTPSGWVAYNNKYIQSINNIRSESKIKFEVGTISKCQIIDEKCVRVYNL